MFSICSFSQEESQEKRKIEIEQADYFDKNEEEFPGATILLGHVKIKHEGVNMHCDKALYYEKDNYLRAFGKVSIKQGDTINLTSRYAEYSGVTKMAFAAGNVKLIEPNTTLTTDTVYFNRVKQQAYYRSGGIIKDKETTLKSEYGKYYLADKKYQFIKDVYIKNPEYTINSERLDYYTDSGSAFLYGKSTIDSKTSKIYCERGYYNTRTNKGYFVKNSKINYENRILEGDSMYFDRNRSFASATNHIKVTDDENKSIVRGHYAEVYRKKDSVFITKRAIISTLQEKDSIHMHADTLMVTGKAENRIIRGFHRAKLFKSDMSGKCDSIHINQRTGLTKLITKPVLFNLGNQMTGDTIHLKSNPTTEKLDSLKVFKNAFLIQKDSIGFNQVKGQTLYGLLKDNALHTVNIIKNAEVIYFLRDDSQELIGINKSLSSSINLQINDNQIDEITLVQQVEGTVYPEEEFPANARKLRGFNNREKEQLLKKSDLFADDEPLVLVRIKGIEDQVIDDNYEKEFEVPEQVKSRINLKKESPKSDILKPKKKNFSNKKLNPKKLKKPNFKKSKK